MRSFVILALAALSVAACTVRTETAVQTPPGRAVVAESASVGLPTIVLPE
jgi:hypothetical protein